MNKKARNQSLTSEFEKSTELLNARKSVPDVKKQKRLAKRKRRRRKILTVFFVVVLAIVGILTTLFLLFQIDEFRIDGDSIYLDDEIIEMLPVTYEDNIFFFNIANTEQAIKSELVYAENVTVRRSLPSTVVVTIEPSVEKYSILADGGTYLLSQSLRALRTANDGENFCPIIGFDSGEIVLGMPITSVTEGKAEQLDLLLSTLEENEILDRITEIDITDTLNMRVVYEGRIEMLLGTELGLEYKLQLATSVLEDEIFPGEYGVLDATVQGKVNFRRE